MSIAQTLATELHRFNAKERNHLMRFALLGEMSERQPDGTDGWVSDEFLAGIRLALLGSRSGDATQPETFSEGAVCIYAAMDYHLDWLRGALWCTCTANKLPLGTESGPRMRFSASSNKHLDIMGNQEDIDLLLVIADGPKTHLVLVEAKGDSSFTKLQMRSKFSRLNSIFRAKDSLPIEGLLVSIVLLAPDAVATRAIEKHGHDKPGCINGGFAPMKMSNFPRGLSRVTRCIEDGENPKGLKTDTRDTVLTHWKIKPRRPRNTNATPRTADGGSTEATKTR